MSGDEVVLVLVRVPAGAAGDSAADLAAEALWSEGATAVEVRDGPEGTTLLAGYPTAEAARAVSQQLKAALDIRVETVTDTSWKDAWREWVHPVPVGRSLLVVPAWRPVAIGSGRLSLLIDSGDCFGSGTHASTRMLLGWLEAHPPVGAAVTDVGTGSGILAVAAARLGAEEVVAVDIDPAAVAVTRANADRNGVAERIRASVTPVADMATGQSDLVLVNVTAGVHADIGKDCARLVRPGGRLLVAGLLPGQWRHVAFAYSGLQAEEILHLDGWEGAVLSR